MNKAFAIVAALVLAAVVSTAGRANTRTTADGFLEAAAPYRYAFPRDHAAHDAYRTEWWYFTGHLQAAGGHRFGYELTFFRVGLAPHAAVRRPGGSGWHGTQLAPAHFAITDERTGRFVYYEDFARDALGQSRASERALDVRVHSWFLRGPMPFKLHAAGDDDAIDLTVHAKKPPAIHGHGGVSRKGPCDSCASHYYSYTRLDTAGEIRVHGTAYRVLGTSWMDHEFGSDELQPDQAGWDWFSIQLNDGREIMLYRLRRKDGSTTPQSSGSLVDPKGGVRFLPLRDFAVRENRTWISPHTGAHYPSAWVLHVRGVGDLTITPVVADQELACHAAPLEARPADKLRVTQNCVTYWEGSVAIRDAQGKPAGMGYVELTGYAQPVVL